MTWKLNSHSTETDNSRLELKLKLRRDAIQSLEKKNVLDLFAGENIIWNNLGYDSYQGVEKEKGKGTNNIHGNNIEIIPKLDLSKYNIIDCDAYGVPFPQIELLFKNNTLKKNTIIFYTCGTNKISNLTKECIKMFGLSNIYKKNRTMLNGYSMDFFYGMLASNGIRRVKEYKIEEIMVKTYGFFIV